MELVVESKIVGQFSGWDGDNVYELTNGQKWQQSRYKYRYRYKYRPEAKVWKDGSHHYLEVEGMYEMVDVRRIN